MTQRLLPAFFLSILLGSVSPAWAQRDRDTDSNSSGGAGAGAGFGMGGGGAGLGSTNLGDVAEQADAAADQAFQAVERADTIGATGETGGGFSSLSVGAQGGGNARGGLGGLGGLGGFGGGGLGGLGNLFGGFGQGGAQDSKPPIRTRLRSAVAVPPLAPATVARNATRRFRSLQNRPELQSINVMMDGRTAVLSGQVGSEKARRMSEMLIRLEPGVSDVVNEVRVQP